MSRAAKQFANARLFGNLQDALEDLSENEEEIVILPPSVDEMTDEEEEVENQMLNTVLPNDIAGSVQILVEDNSDTHEPEQIYEWQSGEKDMTHKFKAAEELQKLEDKYPLLVTMKPHELFLVFFNEEILNLIATETKRYAGSKNQHTFSISKADIVDWICILFTTGFNQRPQEWMYWSKDESLGCSFISKIMSSKRFKEIKRFLHFSNNQVIDKKDKFFKIRRLVNLTKKSLGQFGVFSKFLSIDEQMILYTGCHSCKMYMKSKPIKFGYKSWGAL